MSRLFNPDQEKRILESIAQLERNSTGELRIFVEDKCNGNVHSRVMEIFANHGMQNTANRNAVLIYIAVRSRRVYIWGDEGIHAKAGQSLWDQILIDLVADFKDGMYETGVIRAIDAIGVKLAEYFPPDGSEGNNELPDDIIYGF